MLLKLSQAWLQHHLPTVQTETVEFVPVPPAKRKDNKSDVLVEGEGGVGVTFASCCEPVPGDDIIGFASMRRGITIHRRDCKNIAGKDNGRFIPVSWSLPDYSLTGGKRPNMYSARLKIEGEDRNELLADTTKALGLEGISISNIKAGTAGNSLVRMKIEVRVRDLQQLYSAMSRINEVRGIISVERE